MIILGSASIQGQQVVINPPSGFGGVEAVRLTNYTADVIILGNITGEGAGSQEYLMPFQQAVYPVSSTRTAPTASGQALGDTFATQSLLVEWSTNATSDFPGTYPTTLTEAPIAPSVAQNTTDGVTVLAGNATGTIAPGGRASTTLINQGTGTVYWSTSAARTLGPTTSASLAPGQGVTINGGQTVYLKADATGTSVTFFG